MSSDLTSHIRVPPKEFKKIGNPHNKVRVEENRKIYDYEEENTNKTTIEKKNSTEKRNTQMLDDLNSPKKHPTLKEDFQNININQNKQQVEKDRSMGKENLDKNYYAKEFLKKGYIESYIDYFYLLSRKTPDIKTMKYDKENIKLEFTRELSYNYDISTLKIKRDHLIQAEEYLREGTPEKINKSIEEYRELGLSKHIRDSKGAIYFIQKCINLSKRFEMIKQIIRSLIVMGTRFDNTDDLLLSMSFKEEAKNLFKHLKEKDYVLEAEIYFSLIQLYKDLSRKADNRNDHSSSAIYLNKELENLKNLTAVAVYVKDDKYKESELNDQQIDVYLKIATLNFKMKLYESTIECLKNLESLFKNDIDSDNGSTHWIKGLYLYAQTYEALGKYDEAITYLYNIKNKSQWSMQTSDDNIYAKALLQLGRLHFKQGSLDLSYENLRSFVKKARSADNKELLDIGRVNSGMIRGTQAMKDYIEMIKYSNVNDFLKMKLKFFSENQ